MHKTVDAATFVKIWEKASTLNDVVEQTKMTRAAVIARACNYRRMGVHLKKFPRGNRSKVDVSSLNKLIDSLRKA